MTFEVTEEGVFEDVPFTHITFRGDKAEWRAIVAFKDHERQTPIGFSFYIWDLGPSEEWEGKMATHLTKALNYNVQVSELWSGNGHGSGKVTKQ
jgi:hypothetical protein